MADKVLAIDFGTSNTYLSVCPITQLTPTGIDLHRGEGISSAVLTMDNDEILIGTEAVEEWYDATEKERIKYKLSTHFKPDISTNQKAYNDAHNFFKTLKEMLINQRLISSLSDYNVHVGIPTNKHNGYLQCLKEIAYNTGYGEIRTIEEPVGALLCHLWDKSISPDQARKGILVIDFGGGTCDFAYLIKLDVRYTWGDPFLGGRLFDDLFYQIFIEQNPCVEKELIEKNEADYVHWFSCREAKEKFSQKMKRDNSQTVSLRIGNYGFINNIKWSNFLEKASCYEPSKEFKKYLEECSYYIPDKCIIKSNMIKWFEDSLLNGLQESNISKSDISKVILTGGGSQWLFVEDVIKKNLHIKNHDIIRSRQPYAAISMGLSLLPALQNKYEDNMNEMKSNKEELVDTIEKIVDDATSSFSFKVAEEIVQRTFVSSFVSPLIEFKQNGGKLSELEERIARELHNKQDIFSIVVQEQQPLLDETISLKVNDALDSWFEQYEISVGQGINRSNSIDGFQFINGVKLNLSEKILQETSWISGVVVTAVIASLCGGGGVALIASGPLGLILGGIVGAIGFIKGKDYAETFVKDNIPIPSMILKVILRDSKIEDIKKRGTKDMSENIKQQIIEKFDEKSEYIANAIRGIIDREIESIDEINNIQ